MSDNNNSKEKKAFDSTVCFTFYGSWVEAITDLETGADSDSAAYQLFKAIADYSMYGEEPDFSPENKTLKAIWRVISNEIDNSLDRRKKGFADEGPNEKQIAVIDACVNHPSTSCREIADALGLSKDFVWRTQRKYSGMINEKLKMQQAIGVVSAGDGCFVPDIVPAGGDASAGDTYSDNNTGNASDTDSIATRQVRQLRQDSEQDKIRQEPIDDILDELSEELSNPYRFGQSNVPY